MQFAVSKLTIKQQQQKKKHWNAITEAKINTENNVKIKQKVKKR